MPSEPKFNCPTVKCNKRYDAAADLLQHIRFAHNNRVNGRYLILDWTEGRVWTEERLPSKLQESAKEQLQNKAMGYEKIDNKEVLAAVA